MRVTVRLFATLRDLVEGGRSPLSLDLTEGTTVTEMVAGLGIPAGTVRKVFVGGVAREESYVLRDGDDVGVFPPIAGGRLSGEFLQIRSVGEAWSTFEAAWTPSGPRLVAVDLSGACGRTLGADVLSPEDLPPFPRSVVDGYAVRAADTFGAGESLPAYLTVCGEILMGRPPGLSVGPGEAARIPTGGIVPEGADAAVMVEHCETLAPADHAAVGLGYGAGIEVRRPVAPGDNVIQAGEDVRMGSVAVPGGTMLRPAHIGLLAGLGVTRVEVTAPPRVAVISTGDEVVPPASTLEAGLVRDINGPALVAAVREEGGEPTFLGIVPDLYEPLLSSIREAVAEFDLVLVSGGSSIGPRDEVARAINDLGPPGVLVHGVAMKPGKPTVLGLCRGTPVVGLPGHPTTVMVVFHVFVREIIRRLLARAPGPPSAVRARISRRLASAAGRTDYVRVRLERRDGALWAVPLLGKSGLISTMAAADGLAVIPEAAEGLDVGEEVGVEPVRG